MVNFIFFSDHIKKNTYVAGGESCIGVERERK